MHTVRDVEHHTSVLLHRLHQELGDEFDSGHVDAVGRAHLERLLLNAHVLDYVPVLVYQAAKADLLKVHDGQLINAA